jgi:DNA polymerase-3 subunit delta
MPTKKSTENNEYAELRDALKSGLNNIARLYVFHGEETYLRDSSLASLRELLLPDGTEGFNYRRFSGRVDPGDLREAIETAPFLAERSLVEIWDYDFSKDLSALVPLLRALPEHVCVVFVCDTTEFKPDRRQKLAAELIKLASVVEFRVQEQNKLVPWIRRHFDARGKKISPSDAEYLAFITGGFMNSLVGEIDKITSYTLGDTVTRREIDALVTPVLEAEIYNLTDAVARRDFRDAGGILARLFALREAPQKIIFSLSRTMRQLLLARLYLDGGLGQSELMRDAGIRADFSARKIIGSARGMSVSECRRAVLLCCDAALELNSGGDEATLTELLARLALPSGRKSA